MLVWDGLHSQMLIIPASTGQDSWPRPFQAVMRASKALSRQAVESYLFIRGFPYPDVILVRYYKHVKRT